MAPSNTHLHKPFHPLRASPGVPLETLTLIIVAVCISCLTLSTACALSSTTKANLVKLDKSERVLTLWAGKDLIATYKVALGPNPLGHKERQGDGRTPEGRYYISARNAKSAFHRSLRISYPNNEDRNRAAKLGVNPGGDIMIHGIGSKYGWLGSMHTTSDWTLGCIAVTNNEIEEIWNLVPNGTPIEIVP